MSKKTPNPLAGTELNELLNELPATYPQLMIRTNKPGTDIKMDKKYWQSLNTAFPAIMEGCLKADRLKASLIYGTKNKEFAYSAFPAPKRTLKPAELELLHAILGIISEGGELLNMFMDRLNAGHTIDRKNAVEEFGDVAWFLQLGLRSVVCTLEEAQMINIKKLAERFPDGFSELTAQNRDLEAEDKVLEEGVQKLKPTSDQ